MFPEDDLLPLSALQHLLFCDRQCALIHIEGVWAENRLTVEGRHLHDKAHAERSACEAAGLDSAVGFLHRDRPGRPGLALDLMEEFRPFLADRLALSLINRGQVKVAGFLRTESGAVQMDEATRRTVVAAYQQRKQESLLHPYLGETVTVGLLVHLQARLLARHLRGDLDAYPPFIWK